MTKKRVAIIVIPLVLVIGAVAFKWWQDSETLRYTRWVDSQTKFPEWWSKTVFKDELENVDRNLKRLDDVWFGSEEAAHIRDKLLERKGRLNEALGQLVLKQEEAERQRVAEAEKAKRLEFERKEGLRIAAEKRAREEEEKKRAEEEKKRADAERDAQFAALAEKAKTVAGSGQVSSELPSGLKGKALILSLYGRHEAHAKLPAALRGEPDDPELVIFQVVGYSQKPGIHQYVTTTKAIPLAGIKSQEYHIRSELSVLEVRVIDWKSKTALGTFQVTGPEPPKFVTIPTRQDGFPDLSPIRGPDPDLAAWAARCFSATPRR